MSHTVVRHGPPPRNSRMRAFTVPAGRVEELLVEVEPDSEVLVSDDSHSERSTGLPVRLRNWCSRVAHTPWSTTNAFSRVRILQSSISGMPARTTLMGSP